MNTISPEKVKVLKRLKEVLEKGDIAFIEYMAEIEAKIDDAIPSFKKLLEKIKGDTGETYTLTEEDREYLIDAFDKTLDRTKIAKEAHNFIDYDAIAKKVEKPEDGKSPTEAQLLALMKPLLPNVNDVAIVASRMAIEEIEPMIPEIPEKEEKQTIEEIRDGLEELNGDNRLKYTAIDGLEELLKENGAKKVRLIGGTNGIFLYVNGKKEGIVKFLNFASGTNSTVGYSIVNGFPTITVSSTGGTSFTELPATGSVNSVNTTFTFTVKPTYIVSDGVWYKENVGWTWNAGTLTATMVIPPNDAIWGF